jgi:hypothetical protein
MAASHQAEQSQYVAEQSQDVLLCEMQWRDGLSRPGLPYAAEAWQSAGRYEDAPWQDAFESAGSSEMAARYHPQQ